MAAAANCGSVVRLADRKLSEAHVGGWKVLIDAGCFPAPQTRARLSIDLPSGSMVPGSSKMWYFCSVGVDGEKLEVKVGSLKVDDCWEVIAIAAPCSVPMMVTGSSASDL